MSQKADEKESWAELLQVTPPSPWGSPNCEPPQSWGFVLLASEAPKTAWTGTQAGFPGTILPQTSREDMKGDPASEKSGWSTRAASSQKHTPTPAPGEVLEPRSEGTLQ